MLKNGLRPDLVIETRMGLRDGHPNNFHVEEWIKTVDMGEGKDPEIFPIRIISMLKNGLRRNHFYCEICGRGVQNPNNFHVEEWIKT